MKTFQETLDILTSKDLSALTQGDILFIKARWSYLSDTQKKTYAHLIETPKKVKK